MVSEFLYISCKQQYLEYVGFRPKEEAMDERFWLKGIAGIEREKSKREIGQPDRRYKLQEHYHICCQLDVA